MRIDGDTIVVKSLATNFYREREGKKCNTVRQFRMWSEMKAFEEFLMDYDFARPNKKARILLSPDGVESFERTITDICPFDGYWIISWRHEE